MTDLVKRLRDTASKGVSVWGDLQMEAADTIDALMAKVAQIEGLEQLAQLNGEIAAGLKGEMLALRAENERLQLTLTQRECLRVGAELQRAACELPDGYEIKVEIERGYGCVYLINPSYDAKEFSDTADGLSHCISQAIEVAMKEHKNV